jgi:outer membrane putative beta-barrel porin/alpha-amylase
MVRSANWPEFSEAGALHFWSNVEVGWNTIPARDCVDPTNDRAYGHHEVTGGRVLPGLNVDGNWAVIKNRYSIEFVVANNRVADDANHSHFELATGFTHAFQLSRKLEAFAEWDVFHGSIDPTAPARHYAVGGLVIFATKEFAVDFRAGAGLNAQANRFLIGTGFAFRH